MSGSWERDGGGYENGDSRGRDWERNEPRRESSRSRSPRREPLRDRSPRQDDRAEAKAGTENEGSNLFVSGIAPRLGEEELEELFGKYGKVEGVNIMVDPHTKESRGFGFVKMVTSEGADAAKAALTGEERYGRVLTIEKARRARPRTPTPGKYYGPPKREGPRGDPRSYRGDRGGFRDRYDRGYDDRYDGGRRRDYDSYDRSDRYDRYDRYERPRQDDRYAPRASYGGGGAYGGSSSRSRDEYSYDSRR